MLRKLRSDFGTAVVLITHDMGAGGRPGRPDRGDVRGADRRAGHPAGGFYDAQHPYTWGLLGSIARLDRPKPRRLAAIPGQPPSTLRLTQRGAPSPTAAADHRRRAGLRPRRLDPRAGDQPARRPAGRAAPYLYLHRARPGRGAARVGPHRGHVPGQDRRGVAGRGALPAARPPLHRGAAVRGPDPGPGPVRPPDPDRARGRRAEPDRAAIGLPFPPALPVRHQDLRPAGAAAGRVRRRPPGRLPPPAQPRPPGGPGRGSGRVTAAAAEPLPAVAGEAAGGEVPAEEAQ